MEPLLEIIIKEIREDIKEIKTEVRGDIKDIKKDLHALLRFKYQVLGFTAAISLIITFVFQALEVFLKK